MVPGRKFVDNVVVARCREIHNDVRKIVSPQMDGDHSGWVVF